MAYIAMAIVLSVELFFTHMVSAATFTPVGLAATLFIYLSGLTSAEVGLYIVRNPLSRIVDELEEKLRELGVLLVLIFAFLLIGTPIVAAVWCCLVYMPGALEPSIEQSKSISMLSQAISIGGAITLVMGIGGWLGVPIRFGSFRRLFKSYR